MGDTPTCRTSGSRWITTAATGKRRRDKLGGEAARLRVASPAPRVSHEASWPRTRGYEPVLASPLDEAGEGTPPPVIKELRLRRSEFRLLGRCGSRSDNARVPSIDCSPVKGGRKRTPVAPVEADPLF